MNVAVLLICVIALNSINIGASNAYEIPNLSESQKYLSISDTLNEGTEVCLKEGVECPNDGTTIKYQKLANDSQYCQCSNGRPYLQSCPHGLVFNPDKNVCDYAKTENKFVLEATLNEDTENLLNLEDLNQGSNICLLESTKCPTEDGDFPVYFKIENSSMYCQCSNGFPYQFSCPPGQAFSIETNDCDYERMENKLIHMRNLSSNNPTPEELAAGTKICREGGVVCPSKDGDEPEYFVLQNQSQYCECSNGRPYLFNCPGEEIFDTEAKTCI